MKNFNFELNYENAKFYVQKIKAGDKCFGKLKELLIQLHKHNYIAQDCSIYCARSRDGQNKILQLGESFSTTKLITTKTIKSRGWTQKLIDNYLTVDIYAKNPHYSSAAPMKLYALSKIQYLESNNCTIKEAIKNTINKRKLRKEKHEKYLNECNNRWLKLFSNSDRAIAQMLYLLSLSINSFSYQDQKEFNLIKDFVLTELNNKGYRVASAIAAIQGIEITYVHWFNVSEFKVRFFSKNSFNIPNLVNMNWYVNKKYLPESDRELLLDLTGFKTHADTIKGFYLLVERYKLKERSMYSASPLGNGVASAVEKFSEPDNCNPPTEDEFFIKRMRNMQTSDFKNFLEILKSPKTQFLIHGCPIKLDCKLMGIRDNKICENLDVCSA